MKDTIFFKQQGQPIRDIIELEGLKELTSVKWKLLNTSKAGPAKHRKAVHKLRDYPGVWFIGNRH